MPADPTSPRTGAPSSQTLSRGIRILELLAEATGPLTIDDLAARLAVHRSIAYRLLRTLEEHGLVSRDASGHVALGARMAALAAGVSQDLQSAVLPELTALAEDVGMTAFLVILDRDECITLTSVEPRHVGASVARRPGARHSVLVGAPGKAILSAMPEQDWPAGATETLRRELDEARTRGWATSHDEVLSAVQAVAVPLTLRGRSPAAIAVVHVTGSADPGTLAARLTRAASTVRDSLGG